MKITKFIYICLALIGLVGILFSSCTVPVAPTETAAETEAAVTEETTASSEAPAEGAKEITIGFSSFGFAVPYCLSMVRGAEEEATHFTNVKVISTDSAFDAEKMTSDIDDMIAKGADGIIIDGGAFKALPAGLDAVKNAGVPLVLVNRLLEGGDYTSFIGPDNTAIGVQDGQYIVERLGGEGFLLIIRGGAADNVIGLERTNGLLSEIEKSNIKYEMAPDFGGWTEDGGFTIMEDMLAKYDKIDAVYAENDSMALGAQKAIQDAGRSDEMFLAGVDGQKEALIAIMDGTNFAVTGKNDGDEIGRAGFHRLMAILAGAIPEKDTVLPSPVITIDTAARYYNPDSLF